MRMKKMFSVLLAMAMVFGVLCEISNVVNVQAEENLTTLLGEGDMEIVEVSPEELKAEEIFTDTNLTTNVMEREYTGEQYIVNNGASISSYSKQTSVVENTSPGNAYIVSNDTVTQGQVAMPQEMRWYAFSLNEKSKITIYMELLASLDADLYMFAFDEATSALNLVGGSANAGLGVRENYSEVLDAGVYFFAVGGYEGTGVFAFAFYQSGLDAAYEVNDTVDKASNINFNKSIVGVIDNPYDVDYYKISVSSTSMVRYSISSEKNYSLIYAGSEDEGQKIYQLEGNGYEFTPGTYYFAVVGNGGVYSATSPYTVKFNIVGTLSGDGRMTYMRMSMDAGIVFESNGDGSLCYVNGNLIDINYSYYKNLSNSEGSQLYDITIEDKGNVYACLESGTYEPEAAYYLNSTRPAINVGSKPVLMLTYLAYENFYKINCRGTGAYSKNTLYKEYDIVTVIIDPDTGNLIDIVSYNYFYDFAPVGSNSITVTRPYRFVKKQYLK